MVVKFFANKKGGSSKAIDYLLNEREQQGTARVLQGDANLTRQIINNIKYKQKTTVGCLSFEEKNINEDLKYKLMSDFEKHLLAGLSKEQYNILWVEHTDKGRLELNFIIPKIELTTQKSLNPYYHKADLPRVEKWQDLQNLTHNFTSPKDPSKARTLQTDTKQIGLSKDYEQLDKLLHNLTEQGQINNREQLIELLQGNQIEVTRKGKDYLSIKLPESKKAKKFKGSIYDEQFTSIGEIEDISQRAEQRAREYDNRNIQEEQRRLSAELEKYTREKERQNRGKYADTRRRVTAMEQSRAGQFEQATRPEAGQGREVDTQKAQPINNIENDINRSNNGYSEHSNNIRDNIPSDGEAISGRESDDLLFFQNRPQKENTKGELRNDSTREPTPARVETRESHEFRAYTANGKKRNDIYQQNRRRARELREKHRAVAPRISFDDDAREGSLLDEARENIRAFNSWSRIAERVREAITTVSEKIINFGERISAVFGEKEREKRLNRRESEQERRAAEYVSRIEDAAKIEKEKTKIRTHTRRIHHYNDNDWGMTL